MEKEKKRADTKKTAAAQKKKKTKKRVVYILTYVGEDYTWLETFKHKEKAMKAALKEGVLHEDAPICSKSTAKKLAHFDMYNYYPYESYAEYGFDYFSLERKTY